MGNKKTDANQIKLKTLHRIAMTGEQGLLLDEPQTALRYLEEFGMIYQDDSSGRYHATPAGTIALQIASEYEDAHRMVLAQVIRSEAENVIEVLNDTAQDVIERLLEDGMIFAIELSGVRTYLSTYRLRIGWQAHAYLIHNAHWRSSHRASGPAHVPQTERRLAEIIDQQQAEIARLKGENERLRKQAYSRNTRYSYVSRERG